MKLDFDNHLLCDSITLSLRFVECPLHHVFSGAGWRKHQCPGLKWVADAATFCPFSVVENSHEHDPIFKILWSLPVHVFLKMFLDVISPPNLVAKLLDGFGIGTPAHRNENENKRTSILINFAAGSRSKVILDHRNVFQFGDTCMLCASLCLHLHLSLLEVLVILSRP